MHDMYSGNNYEETSEQNDSFYDGDRYDSCGVSPSRRPARSIKRTRSEYGKNKRTSSLPPRQAPNEAWLRNLHTSARSGVFSARSPRHKGTAEYFVDSLRKSGTGYTTFSAASLGPHTGTGLSRHEEPSFAFRSTSRYLREKAGLQKPPSGDQRVRPQSARGKPMYKEPEIYYEEQQKMKKQLRDITEDNTLLKAKLERVIKDNSRKEKEIGELLNPKGNSEFKRTLTDRRPDSGALVYSLKQRIFCLERDLKSTENAHKKTLSDIRYTNMEEVRIQMETMYEELMHARGSHISPKKLDTSDLSEEQSLLHTKKSRNLNETISRLQTANQQLTDQNRKLLSDLNAVAKEGQIRGDVSIERLNRPQLMAVIRKLQTALRESDERLLQKTKQLQETKLSESNLYKDTKTSRQGKSNERELQLEQEMESARLRMNQLVAERDVLSRDCKEKDARIRSLLDKIEAKNNKDNLRLNLSETKSSSSRRKSSVSPVPPSPHYEPAHRKSSIMAEERAALNAKAEKFRQDHAAKKIQTSWRSKQSDLHKQRKLREAQIAAEDKERRKKAEAMREKHAAKTIQRSWRQHKEEDETLENIQASLMGHSNRKQKLAIINRKLEESEEEGNLTMIQSSMKGHVARKDYNNRLSYDEESGDDQVDTIRNALRGHRARKERMEHFKKYDLSDHEESRRRSSRASYADIFGKRPSYGRRSLINDDDDIL